MGSKLFVGNLSWNVTSDDLQEAFEPFGDIHEAKVIMDRETGRSRGFGFITFKQAADAQAAMADMNGTKIDGRDIRVSEAEDKGERRRDDRPSTENRSRR
jgi:RNA recognition motif-containing protein